MKTNFNDGQEILYSDLNKVSDAVLRTLSDKVIYRMLLSKENAFFQGSFAPSYVNATTIAVAPGVGFITDNTQVSPTPTKRILYLPSSTNKTLAAAHATLPRIDILCVRYNETDEVSESRRFKNLSTSVVSYETMVTQKDDLADLLIVTGTPNASPAAPATPSGYLRIASMTVPAATGMTGSGNVTDERAFMPVGGKTTIDTTAFTRLTAGAAVTVDALLLELDAILTTGDVPFVDLDLYDSPAAEPPAPAVGKKRFFSRNDLLYQKTSGGVTSQIGQTDADTSSVVTTDTTMQSGYAYQTNSAALITMTLPASAVVGARFKIYGRGAGGWKVAVNSGQTLYFGDKTQIFTISSALKSRTQRDCVEIICTVANTDFTVVDFAGSPAIEGNYWGSRADGNVTIAVDTNLSSTTDGDVVVKNYTGLTIDATKTLTVSNRCKGLWIYVDGDCTINGTLTMTARGASANPTGTPAGGIRFARLKSGSTDTLAASDLGTDVGTTLITAEANQAPISANGKIYTIVKVGGAGGVGSTTPGGTITDGPGGGGAGGSPGIVPAGNGAAGTCFSGGAAGGGSSYDPAGTGGAGNTFGGAGGAGGSTSNPSTDAGGGGAGNAGGPGGSGSGGSGSPGGSGTGGLLVLMVRGNLTIGASGVISANGSNGGGGGSGGASPDGGGGGGSGGGRVIVLYGGSLSNAGTIQANGGGQGGGSPSGGAGGAGSVTSPEIVTV